MTTPLRSIREEKVGKTLVRLLQSSDGYVGAIFPPDGKPVQVEGDDPDVLWRKLLAEVGRAHPDYLGFDGAKSRFLKYFPAGFSDDGYASHERAYKDTAVAKIGALLPIEIARVAGQEHCAAAVQAFQATNLVYPVEKTRIKEVLLGQTGPAFLRAATRFADGDVEAGLTDMIASIQGSTQASWPMLTYLPFLWRPDRHLFLKPEVTRDFATRVGHPFARDYAQGLVPAVYESLLNLGGETQREIVQLSPRDLIDVQSFIWVVGKYAVDQVIERPGA